MKKILISIKPEWVAKILNGEKTIDIRKTAPKNCGLPIEVYVYCTKKEDIWRIVKLGGDEFVCSKYPLNETQWKSINEDYSAKGKIVAKFTLKRIDDIGKYAYAFKDDFFYETLKDACLTPEDLTKYAPARRFERVKLYAWHIEDLIVFDKPRMLCEFHTNVKKEPPKELLCPKCGKPMEYYEYKYLKKAPQSWRYIEEE